MHKVVGERIELSCGRTYEFVLFCFQTLKSMRSVKEMVEVKVVIFCLRENIATPYI